MKKRGGFLQSNWAYFVWFVLYFTIGVVTIHAFEPNFWTSLLYTALLYGGSIGIALSPIGEAILRMIEQIQPVQTEEDKDYLIPIFEEVYAQAQATTPRLKQDIQLYISERMTVNAFAIGRQTIAVTRGAILTLTAEELQGVLAHELGHMAHGDTKALLLSVVGNGIFSVIVLLLRIALHIIESITAIFSGKNVVTFVLAFLSVFTRVFVDVAVIVFMFFSDVILAMNSRYSEFLADEYAYQIEYGEELKTALYTFSRISLPAKVSMRDRLRASHPHLTDRIARLEGLLEG